MLDTVQQQQLYLHQLSDLRTAAAPPLPQRSVLPPRTTSHTKNDYDNNRRGEALPTTVPTVTTPTGDEIWEQAVPGHCDKIHEETEILAKIMGWKNIFEFYYKKGHASPA
ncbi:F-box only 36-like protein [Labeo rohita]|uniref:F-box only 36-like protein n=1 Tax=Labeo rohita TaxID=84645 RepID=A0A498MF24_LABRO|nr:F-box only 36-like protein [Labeo rohita]